MRITVEVEIEVSILKIVGGSVSLQHEPFLLSLSGKVLSLCLNHLWFNCEVETVDLQLAYIFSTGVRVPLFRRLF